MPVSTFCRKVTPRILRQKPNVFDGNDQSPTKWSALEKGASWAQPAGSLDGEWPDRPSLQLSPNESQAAWWVVLMRSILACSLWWQAAGGDPVVPQHSHRGAGALLGSCAGHVRSAWDGGALCGCCHHLTHWCRPAPLSQVVTESPVGSLPLAGQAELVIHRRKWSSSLF